MSREERSFAALAALLGVLVMMGPIATDMFLPVIPILSRELGASVGETEFAVTALFTGMAAGQLFYGPLSDRFGRKPIILVTVLMFAASAIGIALSASMTPILIWRFVQGIAASSGRIVANAAARDIFVRERLGRLMSFIMVVGATVSLLTGPAAGIIADNFPWQILFLIMAAYGVLLFILFLFFFRETQVRKNFHAIRPVNLIHNYTMVARNRVFWAYALAGTFIISGLAAYLNSSSGVLIGAYGLSPTVYGFLFSALPLGYMSGSFVAGRFVERTGMDRMISVGAAFALAGALVMFALAIAGASHWAAVIAPMMVYMFGFAMILPQISAGALTPFTHIAGTASSLQGFILSATAAGISALLALFADGTAMPMATAIALSAVAVMLTYIFAIRPLEQTPLLGSDQQVQHVSGDEQSEDGGKIGP